MSAQQVLARLQCIDEAQPVAAGMVGEDAVAANVQQHALGAVGGDVAEAVVVIFVVLRHRGRGSVEEVAGEQADADAQFQHENLVFQRPVLFGGLQGGEEDLGGVAREGAVVVDDEGHRRGVGDERLVAAWRRYSWPSSHSRLSY